MLDQRNIFQVAGCDLERWHIQFHQKVSTWEIERSGEKGYSEVRCIILKRKIFFTSKFEELTVLTF